jgi:hypothetical protein
MTRQFKSRDPIAQQLERQHDAHPQPYAYAVAQIDSGFWVAGVWAFNHPGSDYDQSYDKVVKECAKRNLKHVVALGIADNKMPWGKKGSGDVSPYTYRQYYEGCLSK